jgi:transposase
MGGDRRSKQIEAHGALIRSLLDWKSDITLKEIWVELAKVPVSVGIVTIWRFFQRHRLTLKKRQRMPPSRIARTS